MAGSGCNRLSTQWCTGCRGVTMARCWTDVKDVGPVSRQLWPTLFCLLDTYAFAGPSRALPWHVWNSSFYLNWFETRKSEKTLVFPSSRHKTLNQCWFNSSFTNFALMRNHMFTCINCNGAISLHTWLKIANQNGQSHGPNVLLHF